MENNKIFKKEIINNNPAYAWILDVDGTITSPEEKRVKHPEILTEIVKRLQKGEPVALITGRALNWLLEKVVHPLEYLVDKQFLDYLYVSGEFGGGSITFENGTKVQHIDRGVSLPQQVIEEASKITSGYSEFMFVDPDKQTHFTAEMNNGVKVSEFKEPQKKSANLFRKLLEKYSLNKQFEIHEDRIATNIKDRKANKAYATEQVLRWLKNKGINPHKFIAIGDGKSDLQIGEELSNQGFQVDFVFVGNEDELEGIETNFPIEVTKHHCDTGTAEFLKKFED